MAHPARGTLMGNRGCLHDASGRIVRPFAGRRWITCVLSFKDRRRTLMQPGRYTELFFLDEATALAAGHRPCAECRRADYERFRDAWSLAFGQRPGADAMDSALHAARLRPSDRRPDRRTTAADALPDGTIALIDDAPHLVWQDKALRWSLDGYGKAQPLGRQAVTVVTPTPMLDVLSAGYRPDPHPSVTREG